MTLHIYIAGRQRLCLPYTNAQAAPVARALADNWATLREAGRLAVFVETNNIVYLIAADR